jgi:hypothetical protein
MTVSDCLDQTASGGGGGGVFERPSLTDYDDARRGDEGGGDFVSKPTLCCSHVLDHVMSPYVSSLLR